MDGEEKKGFLCMARGEFCRGTRFSWIKSRIILKLTGMRPFVDLEILRPGEDLSTAGERTGKGLFTRVNPNVVDKLVLGFERPSVSYAVLPETRVGGTLGPADVFDSEVGDDFVHRCEHLVAWLLGRVRLVLVDP